MGDRELELHKLERFEVSAERGFLPVPDPQRELPAGYALWQELAADLPRLLVARRLRGAVDSLRVLDTDALRSPDSLRAAMRVLSFLAHAYVWEDGPSPRLPRALARPWWEVARRLGRPAVLSYASYALDNWRPLGPGPLTAENLAILQNFLGGQDEDWFILLHVEIEALAAPAIRAAPPALRAAAAGDAATLVRCLEDVAGALEAMVGTLRRMPERCDPYIYFHRVRPFIHGWKDHPALRDGLVYEGVEETGGAGQRLRGETGAQSTIVPLLDALLGVEHAPDPLRAYLSEMRDYMPPGHRAFRDAVERETSVRQAVVALRAGHPELAELYDACLHWLEAFRTLHYEYAARYVHAQAGGAAANPSDVGTGGTPFLRYLRKHCDETARHRLG